MLAHYLGKYMCCSFFASQTSPQSFDHGLAWRQIFDTERRDDVINGLFARRLSADFLHMRRVP